MRYYHIKLVEKKYIEQAKIKVFISKLRKILSNKDTTQPEKDESVRVATRAFLGSKNLGAIPDTLEQRNSLNDALTDLKTKLQATFPGGNSGVTIANKIIDNYIRDFAMPPPAQFNMKRLKELLANDNLSEREFNELYQIHRDGLRMPSDKSPYIKDRDLKIAVVNHIAKFNQKYLVKMPSNATPYKQVTAGPDEPTVDEPTVDEPKEPIEKKTNKELLATLNKSGSAKKKAQALHDGLDGMGTDEEQVLSILAAIKDKAEYEEINSAFIGLYNGEDIKEWIKDDFSGEDQEAALKIIDRIYGDDKEGELSIKEIDSAVEIAQALYKSMKGGWTFGLGTDEEAILELLGKTTKRSFPEVLRFYEEKYNEHLLTALESELSGTDQDRVNEIIKRFGYEFQDEDPGYREVKDDKDSKDISLQQRDGNYPQEEIEAVKALQAKLVALGYDIGTTGIDGKFGRRTAAAVAAWKQDNNIKTPNDVMSNDDMQRLAVAKPKPNPTKSGNANFDDSLLQDTVTKGKVGKVLDLIAGPESNGRYDAVYPATTRPEILNMTIAELYQDMIRRGRRSGSSASGRYQYITKTLKQVVGQMNIDPTKVKFSPEVQDKIVIYHLRKSHGLDRWLAGRMSNEAFLNRLAGTWAGIPTTGGKSYFDGILNNKSGITVASAIEQLDSIRTGLG